MVKVRICKHSGDEIDPEKITKLQEPSGGSADQSHEDDVSSDKTQTEELKLPKLDLVTTHVEKDKKVNKRTGTGKEIGDEEPYCSTKIAILSFIWAGLAALHKARYSIMKVVQS